MNRWPLTASAFWLTAAASGFMLGKLRHRAGSAAAAPVQHTSAAAGQRELFKIPAPEAHPYAGPLAAAGAEDMRRFFAEYDALSDAVERREALAWLMARWVELDPRGAVAFFRERNIRSEVTAVLVQWAVLDPAAAAQELQQVTKGALIDREVWAALAARDGSAAIQFALTYPQEAWIFTGVDTAGFAAMARADFTGALEVLSRMPENYTFAAVAGIATGRAAADPAGTLEWADGLGKWRPAAAAAVIGVLAETDPQRAASEFLRVPELGKWASRADGAGRLATKLAVRLGETDPAGALRWIGEAVKNEGHRTEILEDSASGILQEAFKNPERVAEVYRALGDNLSLNSSGFPDFAPAQTLEPVLEAVSALPAGAVRDRLLANLAAQSAQADPLQSLHWLEKITDPAARGSFAEEISRIEGQEAAARAAEFYRALPADLQSGVAGNLAAVQARQDGPAAAEWAQSLPEEPARNKALFSALETWTVREAGKASAWVEALPPGPERDVAAGGLVKSIARQEPSSAFVWSLNIGDSELQTKSLQTTVCAWTASDPAAARAAVENAGLSEIQHDELIKLIKPLR